MRNFNFHSFKKIDAHLHFNIENQHIIEMANRHRFSLVTVNVNFPEFGSLNAQYSTAIKLMEEYKGDVYFISSFPMDHWQSDHWLADTLMRLERDRQRGALAVKIWKDIGMAVRDDDGRLLMLDDSRLDALFTYLEDNGFVVMMHQGEPKNCWLPIEQMTMRYDREYFESHPQYHFYLQPEMPTYDQLLQARNNRLRKHFSLKTIQAHLGSMEWNVEHIAQFLDAFPNANVDTAARMNHLMLQAKEDRQKVLDFFVRYQDRILYATDFFVTPHNRKSAADELEQIWLRDWRFLSTNDLMHIDDFDGVFYGLGLQEEVLYKIYYENAVKVFKQIQAKESRFIHV